MNFQDLLKEAIESELNIKIIDTKIPPQGMTSKVFFIETNNQEYAVKYGKDAMNDVPAFELIEEKNVTLPIPKLIKAFTFNDTQIVIMEKVKYPLLDSINVSDIAKYIPSMIETQKLLHTVKSPKPGLLTEPNSNKSWKNMMLQIFEGGKLDWEDISNREVLDKKLILDSVNKIKEKINSIYFDYTEYSLLHTDYNQRNLFVDPDSDQITGIIDWEEAMFGDPIYDFARIRMFIWHFKLGQEVVDKYYYLMNYTPNEKKLDNLYWLSRVIEYLAWYSEELNEFNSSRIKLHQNFLRDYKWEEI